MRTYFTIVKKDFTTGEAISGVTFEIKDTQGNLIRTEQTNVNGEIKLYGLPEGTYFAYETGFPDGYIHNAAPIRFTIGLSDEKDTTVTNTQTKVTLKKTDAETGRAVSGVLFDLYMVDGSNTVKVNENALKTDENGEISVSKLKVNVSYYFVEIQPANGYYNDTNEYRFVIDETGKLRNMDGNEIDKVFVQNTPTSINLLKVDADDPSETLAGVVFNIYAKNGTETGNLVDVVTTDENGIANISRLPEGAYYAVEVGFPTGYIQDGNTKYDFEINAQTKDAVIKISNKKTSVTLSKIDLVNGEPVEGATIEIYNQNHELVYSGVTDTEGTITVDYLPIGTYTYREIECSDGYVLDETVYTFTIDAEGNVEGENVIVTKKTSVEITKTDESGNSISGAVIGIFNEDGELLMTLVTDENGKAIATGLLSGKYYFQEILPASGYEINSDKYDFEITREGFVLGTNSLVNKLTTVVINKTDKNGTPLAGAIIGVFNENDELVYEGTTDENGQIIIRGLPQGRYYAVEKQAPKGYLLNNEKVEFVIDEFGIVNGNIIITNELALAGDVNQDGKINAVDARWVLQIASGTRSVDSNITKQLADVNGDGKINAVDARWILQIASGIRTV